MRGLLTGFLIGNVYALYTWLLWPVLVRSAFRQLTHRRTWSKTEREPIEIDDGGPPGALPHAPAAPVNSPL